MFRSVLSVVIGFMAGALVVGLLEAAGHMLYPPPSGIDVTDQNNSKRLLINCLRGAIIMVLVAWAAGSLAGGFVAALIAKRKPYRPCLHRRLPANAGRGNTMLMIPHPTWFVVTSFLVVVPSALLGAMLAGLVLRAPPGAGPQPYDMRKKNMAC